MLLQWYFYFDFLKILSVLKILYHTGQSRLYHLGTFQYILNRNPPVSFLSFVMTLASYSSHSLHVGTRRILSCFVLWLFLERSSNHANKIVLDLSKTRFLIGTQTFLIKLLAGHLTFEQKFLNHSEILIPCNSLREIHGPFPKASSWINLVSFAPACLPSIDCHF